MLILARHGRTQANARGLLQGHLDLPLDEVGEQQAAAIGRRLGKVDAVITSPLLRARQTAAHVDGPLTVDERWIELDYGALDGVPLTDVPRETWAKWRADVTFAPGGGESILALMGRVTPALEELADMAAAGTVVVVTHVSPIKAALAWALGAPAETSWRSHLDQAALTRISFGGFGPVLHGFNETSHLS
jgi:broad specificity phosphatase PhoE